MMRTMLLLGCGGGLIVLAGCGSRSEPVRAEASPTPVVEERVALFGPAETSQTADTSFPFASDGIGELLRERLTPSAPASEPIPFVNEPRSWHAAGLGQSITRSGLPSALAAVQEPCILIAEKVSSMRLRRVLDVPPLAADLALPGMIVLPVGPLASASAPDVSQPPATELAPPVAIASETLTDPTAELSRQAMLVLVDSQRREPVPFMQSADAAYLDVARPSATMPVEMEPPAGATVPLPTLPLPVK